MALSVESIIRNQGAIPATISCLDGRFLVGMTSKEIETLAKVEKAAKISRRDLAVVSSRGMTGGTTIAGTMILAHMAGIKVFATGVCRAESLLIIGSRRGPPQRRSDDGC